MIHDILLILFMIEIDILFLCITFIYVYTVCILYYFLFNMNGLAPSVPKWVTSKGNPCGHRVRQLATDHGDV